MTPTAIRNDFTIRTTLSDSQGKEIISMLHTASDFGFMQDLAFGFISNGYDVQWLTEEEVQIGQVLGF